MPYAPNHILQGIVTKTGVMKKTATVTVERVFEHPKILKEIKRHKKYLVHDEGQLARLDDKVTIIHGLRTSRTKSFRLHSILSRDTRKYPNDPIPSTIPPPQLKPRKETQRVEKFGSPTSTSPSTSTSEEDTVVGGVLDALKDLGKTITASR